MSTNTGGPAFPAHHFDLADGEHGMTLRDYFAAKAMQSMLRAYQNVSVFTSTVLAKDAYVMADAMLKEREK